MEKTIASKLYKVVIEGLVELRKEAKLSQRELAGLLQREPSLVAKLELGERRLDFLEFYQLCKVLKQNPGKIALRLIRRLEAQDKELSRSK